MSDEVDKPTKPIDETPDTIYVCNHNNFNCKLINGLPNTVLRLLNNFGDNFIEYYEFFEQ